MNYEKIDLLTNNAVEILPSVYSEALSYSDMLGNIVSQLNTVEEMASDLANIVTDAPGQAELDAIIVEAGQLAGLAQEYATIATQLADIASTKAMEASGYATTASTKATEAAGYAAATYTKTEVDGKDALKADKSTTYTKTENDTAMALKADKATTYTKTEVDTKDALKADKSDTYTKTEVDTKDALKADKVQEGWITPTLLDGATGTLKFRKNQLGRVEFKGYITNVPYNNYFLTMPTGYYNPSDVVLFAPACSPKKAQLIHMTIYGTMYQYTDNATTSDIVSFDGVAFSIT